MPEDFDFDFDPPRMGYNRQLNNAANPDLRAFVARGGKLISYQGWSDQSVPPMGVIDYLNDVENFMGGMNPRRCYLTGVHDLTGRLSALME